MKDSHKRILRKYTVKLTEDIEPVPLLRYLYQMSIFSQEDKENILSLKKRYDVNGDLLSKLTRRGPQAFPKLVEGLEKTQPFLACMLLREENQDLLYEQAKKERELTERNQKEINLLEKQRELEKRIQELETQLTNVGSKLQCAENEKKDLSDKCNHLESMVGRSSSHGNSASSAELRRESGFQEPLSPAFDEQGSEFQQRKDSSMNGPERHLVNSTGLRQSRRAANELSSLQQENRTSTQISGRELSHRRCKKLVFSYENDFDKKGVIHYLGSKAGQRNEWLNPARVPSSGVKVTCSDSCGDPENILEYYNPVKSYTNSWWCVDLGEEYTLFLTHYTLRHIGSNDKMFLTKWELQGRLNSADNWVSLVKHRRCDWSKEPLSYILSRNKNMPCKTKTWSIKGEAKPFRYFKVGRIEGETNPLVFKMSLAGMELYGVLQKYKHF